MFDRRSCLALAARRSADVVLFGQASRAQVTYGHQFAFDLLYLFFEFSYLLFHDRAVYTIWVALYTSIPIAKLGYRSLEGGLQCNYGLSGTSASGNSDPPAAA